VDVAAALDEVIRFVGEDGAVVVIASKLNSDVLLCSGHRRCNRDSSNFLALRPI
jgi:hypothetical protein